MIIDTFEIVIKSNAKQAQKEVKDTGEEVKKTQTKLNETDKVSKSLADTLLSVGLNAVAAFASFETLREGIKAAADFNFALEKTHQLFGANVKQISAWDYAFSQFGGQRGDFTNWINQIGPDIIKSGGSIESVINKLRSLSEDLRNLPEDKARLFFQNVAGSMHIPQSFYEALRTGGAALDKALKDGEELAAVTEDSAQAAYDLANANEKLKTSWTGLFTPAIEGAAKLELLLVGVVEIIRKIASFLSIPFTGTSSFSGIQKEYDEFKASFGFGGKSESTTSSANTDLQAQSRAFWTAQGFSPAQVAGLLANEQAESGYNPGAVGDNGQAKGIFQWHGDRRKNILDALGIDISTASHADQLKAAAWELQQRGDADRLRTAQTPEQAAGIITQYFERPADIFGQSAYRGRIAASLSAADNSPLNNATTGGSSNNVSIGNITVHTQAPDANGIASDIKKSLDEHLSYMIADVNDGIAK